MEASTDDELCAAKATEKDEFADVPNWLDHRRDPMLKHLRNACYIAQDRSMSTENKRAGDAYKKAAVLLDEVLFLFETARLAQVRECNLIGSFHPLERHVQSNA